MGAREQLATIRAARGAATPVQPAPVAAAAPSGVRSQLAEIRRVRTPTLNALGLTGGIVKRRAAGGEPIVQEGPRAGTRGEQMGALGIEAVTGAAEGLGGMVGFAADAATDIMTAGPVRRGARAALKVLRNAQLPENLREPITAEDLAPPMRATATATAAADDLRENLRSATGLDGVEIGPVGDVTRFVANVATPGPELVGAARQLRKGATLIDDAAAPVVASVADDAAGAAVRSETGNPAPRTGASDLLDDLDPEIRARAEAIKAQRANVPVDDLGAERIRATRDVYEKHIEPFDRADVPLGQRYKIDEMFDSTASTERAAAGQAIYDSFAGYRKALKERVGPTVRLYRFEAPASTHLPNKTVTHWMDDPEVLKRNIGATDDGVQRELISRDVPVDDIVAAPMHGQGGLQEFIVLNRASPVARIPTAVTEKSLWDSAQAAIKHDGKWYAKGGDSASHSALRQELGLPDQPNWPGIEDSGWIIDGETITVRDLEATQGSLVEALASKRKGPPGTPPPGRPSGTGGTTPGEPIPKYAEPSSLNTERMLPDDEAKRWFVDTMKAVDDPVGGNIAKALEDVKGEPLTHVEIQRASERAKLLTDPTTRAATLDLAADLFHSRKIIDEMAVGRVPTKEFVDLVVAVSSKRTEVARILNSQAMRTGGDAASVAMREVVEKLDKLGKNADEIVEELKDVDFSDAKQVEMAFAKTRTKMETFKQTGMDLLNVPRSLMASIDLSAPFRQGMFLIGRPRRFFGAFGPMLKSFASESAYADVLKSIEARPSYQRMHDSGLAITRLNDLSAREEAFASNLAEKIPIVGRGVRASGRAYTAYLDKLRADVFDDIVAKAEGVGLKFDKKLGPEIASYVNAATGRGEVIDSLKGAQNLLNAMFFSPKLIASRLTLLNPVTYVRMSPFLRKQALADFAKFVGVGTSILSLAKLGGAEVGTDPRSADFGKIRTGDTRVDVWGGFQQYVRMATQIITGEYISTSKPEEVKALGEGYKSMTRMDILLRQFESKLAPIPSFAANWLRQRDYRGLPFDATQEIKERFWPMIMQDSVDLWKKDPSLMPLMIPAALGMGVQTYDSPEEVARKRREAKAKAAEARSKRADTE